MMIAVRSVWDFFSLEAFCCGFTGVTDDVGRTGGKGAAGRTGGVGGKGAAGRADDVP